MQHDFDGPYDARYKGFCKQWKTYNQLTTGQKRLLEGMYHNGCPFSSIAKVFDLNGVSAVSQIRLSNGWETRKPKNPWTEEERELACYLWFNGEDLDVICKTLSRPFFSTRNTIQGYSKKFGYRVSRFHSGDRGNNAPIPVRSNVASRTHLLRGE